MIGADRCLAIAACAVACAATLGGCGGVVPIDVHDERVPLEARQWVGGADDGVAIAVAGYDDARAELADMQRWKNEVAAGKSRRGGALESQLGAFVAARMTLAEARVDTARAAVDLARATRTLVHAETAMRYDLAVYDLVALRAAVESSRNDYERLGREVEEAVVARDKASESFWAAYRAAYAQSPEVGALFWLAE